MTAKSKAEAVARMYVLAGAHVEELGPGSKEKRSAFEALGRAVGLDVRTVRTKTECCRLIAARLGVEWDEACFSAGDTITLTGINRLLDAPGLDSMVRPVAEPHGENINDSRSTALETDENGLERQIAEAIAELTLPTETPGDFGQGVAQVDPDAIRFDDGSWRTHLSSVAPWLHLPDNLNGSSEEAFDASLAVGLGLEHWAAGDESSMRERLLPKLADRLDRALGLQKAFVDDMEAAVEGAETRASATAKWAEAWIELEVEDEVEGSGPIHAEADVWSISDFVAHARDDELNLSPSYQRADVWPTSNSQLLVESILRGIPLPSVIILERDEEKRTTYEVVDGKQRLTSILRFIGRHPRAVELVKEKAEEWGEHDLLDVFQTDYPRFKKLWKKNEVTRLTAQVERQNYFPFPLRSGDVRPLSGELEALRGRYYGQIRDIPVPVLGHHKPVRLLFEQTSKYKLPVITYKQVESEQIHEVFSLYNKQGKHLNAEEIRNALYHHLALMKALVVTAGDSGTVESDAPFLQEPWADLKSSQEVLDTYGFGHAGYKRTKVLSWVASVLLLDDGSPERRSTANQINALLKRVEKDRRDPLRDEAKVRGAMIVLDKGLDAHAAIPPDVWAKRFVNSQATGKWQELQLVASLIALSAAYVVHGDDLQRVVEAKWDAIAAASATWVRPAKTQSKEQWIYVARVVAELLALLDAPVADAEERLREQFGASGLGALVALREP